MNKLLPLILILILATPCFARSIHTGGLGLGFTDNRYLNRISDDVGTGNYVFTGSVTTDSLMVLNDITMAGLFTNTMQAADTQGLFINQAGYTGTSTLTTARLVAKVTASASTNPNSVTGFKIEATQEHAGNGSPVGFVQNNTSFENVLELKSDHSAAAQFGGFQEINIAMMNTVRDNIRTITTTSTSGNSFQYIGQDNNIAVGLSVDYDGGDAVSFTAIGIDNNVSLKPLESSGTLTALAIGEKITVVGLDMSAKNGSSTAVGLLISGVSGADTNWAILNDSNADSDFGSGGITTTGTIDCTEIFNSGGDLKIMPDVQGDAVFFGDTDVDNAADGKAIWIKRQAAEADGYIKLYTDAAKNQYIRGSGHLLLTSESTQISISPFNSNLDFIPGATSGSSVFNMNFRTSGGSFLCRFRANGTNDEMLLGVDDNVGNQFILTNYANVTHDHDQPVQTNPTFYIFSDISPNTSPTFYGKMWHDQTDFNIESGAGNINYIAAGGTHVFDSGVGLPALSVISATGTFIATSGGPKIHQAVLNVAPASNSTANYKTFNSNLNLLVGTQDLSGITGASTAKIKLESGSGDITGTNPEHGIAAFWGEVNGLAGYTGTVANIKALLLNWTVNANNVVTNAHMIWTDALDSGTVTNAYGIKLGDVTAGSVLNIALETGLGDVLFGGDVTAASYTTTGNIYTGSILAGTDTSGVLTLGGTGGTYDENLTFDFDYFTNEVYLSSSSGTDRFIFGIKFQVLDDTDILLGGGSMEQSSDVALRYNVTQAKDSLQLGLRVGNDGFSGYFSIMEKVDIGHVNRSPLTTTANPTLRIYSSDETVATDYIEFFHNQTDAYIQSGTGDINILPADDCLIDAPGDVIVRFGNEQVTFDGTAQRIRTDTKLWLGSTNHNTQINTDGLMTMLGRARVIRHLDLANASFTKGHTAPTEVIIGNYTGWEFTIGDDAHMDFVIPHEWDSTTDITVKFIWYVDEAYVTNSGEVNWQLAWSATPTDASEALDAPTHTGTDSSGDQNIPATAKFLTITTIETIPAASLAVMDIIGIEVSRIALVGGANPSATPGIIDIHIEYIANKLGEAT